MNRNYLRWPSYAGKETLPVALSGSHGGGQRIAGVTLAAWIKPAAEMGRIGNNHKGDVIGFGARRFLLGLEGLKAPYRLETRINVNDRVTAPSAIDADRWYHIAMTAELKGGPWHVRLFLDGQPVAEGETKSFTGEQSVPPSLVVGTEIFYFHDAYYRGLVGPLFVFDRALAPSRRSPG